MVTEGPPRGENDSITSGYRVPCTRKPTSPPTSLRLGLEDLDEFVPDDLALLFRIGDPGELGEKPIAGIHHPEVDAEVATKRLLDLVPFVESEQTVVDENAGEPVAHGAMNQRRGDRRVHSAREPADHPRGGPDLARESGPISSR